MLRKLAILSLALAASPVFAPRVRAQEGFAPPPQIPYGLPIDLETARSAASAAVATAGENGWLMAVAVVDTGGYLVYFEKMDGTQTGSVDVAIDKARSHHRRRGAGRRDRRFRRQR